MTIYLDECQCGVDSSTLGFPHVLLCMAVVLQTKTALFGMHFDTVGRTPEFAAALLKFIRGNNGDVDDGVRLYGCCNRRKRYSVTKNLKSVWEDDMTTIAGILGYSGPVTGFDTVIINPTKGTYIEFERVANSSKADVFYKRHEKMDHHTDSIQPKDRGTAATGTMWTWSVGRNDWEANKSITRSANLASGATTLHKLNYFLRADTFTV